MIHRGEYGGYYWVEAVNRPLEPVLKACPEFVLGKYLIVTAHNGAPLRLTHEDFKSGWLQHDDLAINPLVGSVSRIRYHAFDEWYIFSKTPLLEQFKVFVNNRNFSLREPSPRLNNFDTASDIAGEETSITRLRELQELFWLQLELKGVETYVASGERLILATREPELCENLVTALSI